MTNDGAAPCRVLVLGTSGILGTGLSGPDAKVWPEIVRERLAERLGPVELTRTLFYVHGRKPFAFLERELAAEDYDYIILQCVSVPATLRTVPNRVTNLFGKRAGAWTEAKVRAIDRQTQARGTVRDRANIVGHRIARRLIGTAAQIDPDTLIDRYRQAINRVAMVETATVAVIGTGFASKAARENNPQVVSINARFNQTLLQAVRQKHFHWVDSDAVTRETNDPDATFIDPVHKGQGWHDGIAGRVAAAFLDT